MKILVPTDFSDSAKSAEIYGARLAKHLNAKLVLFHFYNVPIPITDVPITIDSDLLEKDANKMLLKRVKELHRKIGNDLDVEYHTRGADAAYGITALLKKNKFDYVVMGIHGAGESFQRLLGSTVAFVIRHVDCPVIIVPKGDLFKTGGTIAFASDFLTAVNPNTIKKIKKFVKGLNLKLHVVNVVKPEEEPTMEKAIQGLKLEKYLQDVNHSLHFPESKKVVDGINEFVNKHKIDVVAMIPKKHSLLERVIHPSKTRKLTQLTNAIVFSVYDKG